MRAHAGVTVAVVHLEPQLLHLLEVVVHREDLGEDGVEVALDDLTAVHLHDGNSAWGETAGPEPSSGLDLGPAELPRPLGFWSSPGAGHGDAGTQGQRDVGMQDGGCRAAAGKDQPYASVYLPVPVPRQTAFGGTGSGRDMCPRGHTQVPEALLPPELGANPVVSSRGCSDSGLWFAMALPKQEQ